MGVSPSLSPKLQIQLCLFPAAPYRERYFEGMTGVLNGPHNTLGYERLFHVFEQPDSR